MWAARFAFAFSLAAVSAFAQGDNRPEIRGTAAEAGLGIPGVTITLYELGSETSQASTRGPAATTLTDARGAFRFQPAHAGEYYVEARKDGYINAGLDDHGAGHRETAGESVNLDPDHPSREMRLSLTRLGELRGRVIDEDGKPLASLRVIAHPPESSPSPDWVDAISDQDGYFVAAKLRPGNYLLRIAPQRADLEVSPQFSEGDLKIVDQDLESSESPGTPIPVGPGGSLSVGTITVRRTPYYRAHVIVLAGDCAAGEKWNFTAVQPEGPESPFARTLHVPCGKEFLIRSLEPGSYLFALTSGRETDRRWAAAPVEIARDNVDVTLTMSPGVDLEGRLIAADGATVLGFERIRIVMLPDVEGFTDFVQFGTRPIQPDSRGRFLIKGLQGDRQRVIVEPGGESYVKEIRYSGLVAPDGVITLARGSPAQLEIVMDDHAASVSGMVTDGDQPANEAAIIALKWPVPANISALFLMNSGTAAEQGRFRIDGLAPGEYRVMAIPFEAKEKLDRDSLIRFLERADKVTLERGGSQSVSLKLVQP